MSNKIITRRTALQAAATAGLGMLAGSKAANAATEPRKINPIRFDDPIWNRETKARLDADITGKQVLGAGNGIVHAVRDGQKVQPVLRFEIFSTLRVLKQPDGSYQRLCKEVVFYRDFKTNQILDEWDNPLTGERVPVVDIANDPYNYKIAEFFPDPPGYGGLNQEKAPPRRPYILNWSRLSDDTIGLETDVHLLYPSAMQPENWPRESPGKMTRASEIFRYFIRREDIENPDLTHIPYNGTWVRVTPWLPWMLMDQAPGHMLYVGNMHTRKSLDEYPQDVIARVKERYPQYLTAPETWYGPSLSSLENYARFQKPAPPKAKP